MNISVFGAGAWGTALGARAAARHFTWLWARDAAQAEDIAARRRNSRYLPDLPLPPALGVTADFDAALVHCAGGLAVVATPMAALAELLGRLDAAVRAGALAPAGVLWLCKGFEPEGGALGHELARRVAPALPVGVLSGPSFAIEVARGQPSALVAASVLPPVAQLAVDALHGDGLRIYTSDDPVGVEVGGAVKNVLAIATGICDGMSLGLNARAALVTRGLAEMTRLGVALGARADTFMGLSGLGDLVLTATGDLSRNRTVGLRLATGAPLATILAELGHVAEGVVSAPRVLARARDAGVEMPIVAAVVAVLDGTLTPSAAIDHLMERESRAENNFQETP